MDEFTFAVDFLKKEEFPQQAVAAFSQSLEAVRSDGRSLHALRRIRHAYLDKNVPYKAVSPAVRAVGRRLSMTRERIDFVFLLLCLRQTRQRYEQKGLTDTLFYDTFADLKYKNAECKAVRNEWGTFVAYWYDGFFRLERFCCGRFQYELAGYAFLRYERHGVKLKKGSPVINFHIPSSGEPLTYETRLASYQKAYELYRGLFGDGKAVFVCFSWLLYRGNKSFLPPGMNISDFMDDFDIVKSIPMPFFADGWRIFGARAKGRPQDLPEETALQRAFKKRLTDKKPFGSGFGYGVLVFDGTTLLTRDCHIRR